MATEKQIAYRESQYERKVEMLRMVGCAKPAAEIIDLLRMLDEIGDEVGYTLRPDQAGFGKTREQLVTIAQSKLKANKRRAGVKALERKYGHDVAANIVYKHSGRTIR